MNIAVIFAGGAGTRMKSRGLPKQFLEVHGKPIIQYTLEHFERHTDIHAIAVICIREYIEHMRGIIDAARIKKVKWLLPGGKTPLESQYIGLCAVKDTELEADRHIVLMHDGVRPLIDADTITRCIHSVKECGSAITISPAIETIITVDANDEVVSTFKRKDCRLGRAPQCFYLNDLLGVHNRALADGLRDVPDLFIDSATMMQYYGKPIHVVEGPVENIKITTAQDFYVFRAIIDAKESFQILGID